MRPRWSSSKRLYARLCLGRLCGSITLVPQVDFTLRLLKNVEQIVKTNICFKRCLYWPGESFEGGAGLLSRGASCLRAPQPLLEPQRQGLEADMFIDAMAVRSMEST